MCETEIRQALFDENRAVSPVIGVILMVAITVILAAVIGAFVLGIGGQQEKIPQTRFDFDFSDGAVTITHGSGDALTKANIAIVVDGSREEGALSSGGSDDTFTAGEELYSGGIESGDEIRIIWRSSTSDTTTTLGRTTAP